MEPVPEKAYRPGTHGYHELVDRLYVVSALWDVIIDHPAVLRDADIYNDAARIEQAIANLYQKVANAE